jgi:hypothetical protein
MRNNNNNNRFDADVNTARVDMNGGNGSNMFAANNILRQTEDNLATSEAETDEEPLRTEKTTELEEQEETTTETPAELPEELPEETELDTEEAE